MTDNSNSQTPAEQFGADTPVTPQEEFVNAVYASLDRAIAAELDRLRREDGVSPSCKAGCCHCCRHHILMNVAEAHTLAQYVKRELSPQQTNDLRIRTQQWHQWDNSRPSRYLSATITPQPDLAGYRHCCPMLENDRCIAYPARPIVCRTHFACSHPLSCSALHDPQSTQDPPVILTSIRTTANPFAMEIDQHLENEGLDYSRSTMLLPHCLAIEMKWDFAISP